MESTANATKRPDLEREIRQALSMREIWLKGGNHIPKRVALLLEQIEPYHDICLYRYHEDIQQTLLAWEEGIPARLIAEESFMEINTVLARIRSFVRLLIRRLEREDIRVYCEDTHGKGKHTGKTKNEPVQGCTCPACERLRR